MRLIGTKLVQRRGLPILAGRFPQVHEFVKLIVVGHGKCEWDVEIAGRRWQIDRNGRDATSNIGVAVYVDEAA